MGIAEILLTNVTVSAIVAGIMSLITNLVYQKRAYRDDYHKTILAKRLEAYESVFNIVMQLKITVLDERDGKPYHIGLCESPKHLSQTLLSMCMAAMSNIWLSEAMIENLTSLNKITYRMSLDNNSDNGITLAKDYYKQIGQIRNDIENCIRKDLKDLYDVKKFLDKQVNNKSITFPC